MTPGELFPQPQPPHLLLDLLYEKKRSFSREFNTSSPGEWPLGEQGQIMGQLLLVTINTSSKWHCDHLIDEETEVLVWP